MRAPACTVTCCRSASTASTRSHLGAGGRSISGKCAASVALAAPLGRAAASHWAPGGRLSRSSRVRGAARRLEGQPQKAKRTSCGTSRPAPAAL
eukprot:scaffold111538_cov63-Phaeocystis_antarctica.AAC.2